MKFVMSSFGKCFGYKADYKARIFDHEPTDLVSINFDMDACDFNIRFTHDEWRNFLDTCNSLEDADSEL